MHLHKACYVVCLLSLFNTCLTNEERFSEKYVGQLLNDLYQLLNQSDPISVDDVILFFDQVNNVLQLEQDDVKFPGIMLHFIDELGARVDLNGSCTVTIVRENIALLVADTAPENPVLGIALANTGTDILNEDSFSFLSNINSNLLDVNVNEAVVYLPLSVTRHPRRISFVVFRDARAFSYDHELYFVNSRVISINIDNFAGFKEHEVVDIHLRPLIAEPSWREKRVCAFWNILEDGTGDWSQNGCTFVKSSDPWMLDTCQCDHLTHFAEVLIADHRFIPRTDITLTTLAIIGCTLSILSLMIIALTAVLFKSWRKNFRNQIWLQLAVSLFSISICYLVVIFARYEDYSVSCMLTGMVLHFCIVGSYCWMFTAACKALSELYLLPDTNPGSCIMLLASCFSWGIPILKVALLAISEYFMEPFVNMDPISKFCKPAGTNLWLTFFTPTAVLMVASLIVFFFVIYKLDIGPSNRNEEITDKNRNTLAYARVGLGLLVLAGLPPWLFSLFSYNIVGAYFHACTATTQGLILFLFIICGDAPTRNLWLHKLRLQRQNDITPLTRQQSVD